MQAVEKKVYTYEDYAQLPEGAPYQLIDGELVMSPSPTPAHQRILRKLTRALDKFVEEHECGWYTPPSDAARLAERVAWIGDHPDVRIEAGRKAWTVARAQFDRTALVLRLEQIFQQAATIHSG